MKKTILTLLISAVMVMAVIDISLAIRKGSASVVSQNSTPKTNQSLTDKCQPEPGYTTEEWQDHISHHPDQYQECLTADE